MRTNNQRLRRFFRNCLKDESWIEITNWHWYGFDGEEHIEPCTDITPLNRDFCQVVMSRHPSKESGCYEKIEVYGGDCLVRTLRFQEPWNLEKIGDYHYKITDNLNHEVVFRRPTEQELKDKGINPEE